MGDIDFNFKYDGAADAPAPPPDSQFSRGLRSSLTSAGGGLNELAGAAGESLGFDQFAKDRYAASKEAQKQAEEEAPSIRKFSDVHGVGDFAVYAGNKLAESAPTMIPAIGAGLLARTPLGKLAAATIATAPMAIGGKLQQYRDDPVIGQQPIDNRLKNAVVYGTGETALQNIVPAAVGGQIAGVGAAAVRGTLAKTIGKAVATDAAGNAIAGGASARLGQFGEAQLNPNRDTTHDNENTREAAIGGGVVGAALGPLGGLGEYAHAKPKVDPSIVRKIANDEPLVSGAKNADHIALSDQQAVEHTKSYVSELLDNTSLPPEIKQQVMEKAQNLGDAANRAYIATQKLAADAQTNISDLYQRVVKPDEPAADADGVKKSEDYSGVRSKISDIIMPVLDAQSPELAANPKNAQLLADTMRVVIDKIRAGDRLPPKTLSQLHDYFGDSLPNTLHEIHDALHGDSPDAATATYYNSLARMTNKMQRNKVMNDVVSKNLADPDSATTGDVKELVEQLRNHVRRPEPIKAETPEQEAKAAQRKFHETQLDAELAKTFGANKDKVIKAFEDEHEGARTEQARKDATSESAKERADAGIKDETLTGGDLKDQYETPQVYGGKGENPFTLSHKAHVRDFGNGESQSKRLLAKAKEENPDRNVSAIPAKEYAAENGISPEKLHELTGGKPDDHVVVAAEGMKQVGRLTRDQVNSMKLDTKNRAGDKSRVETDKGSFDAVKITREMKKTMPRVEGQDGLLRTARAFFEGVGGVLDATGGKFGNNADAPKLAAKVAEGKAKLAAKEISIKDVPPLVLERVKVDRPVMDNGKETTAKMSAKEALADIDTQHEAYKALLGCLGG